MDGASKSCRVCGSIFDDPRMGFCPRDGAALTGGTEATKPVDPFVGRVIASKFRVSRRLGQGGMGTVYLAHQLPMGREVALKLLRAELAEERRVRTRFQREAQAASRIDSPRTITIHDFGETEAGLLYLAMEYVRGVSLAERIDGGDPLPVSDALRIARDVCLALDAAHRAGIVHRDLKPDNIMLSDDGRVKVLDFGIAKILEEASGDEMAKAQLTQVGAIIGTPMYISPEAVERKPVGPAADLYSLGVILFEMVAGRPPFEDDKPVLLMGMHVRVEPEPLGALAREAGRSIPRSLDRLAHRLLAKRPEDRPEDAAEVARELEQCRAECERGHLGDTVDAKPGMRRTRLRLAVAGALLAALLGAGAWLATGSGASREASTAPAPEPIVPAEPAIVRAPPTPATTASTEASSPQAPAAGGTEPASTARRERLERARDRRARQRRARRRRTSARSEPSAQPGATARQGSAGAGRSRAVPRPKPRREGSADERVPDPMGWD